MLKWCELKCITLSMSDILGSLPLSSSKEKMLKVGTKKGNQWRKKTPKREKRKQTNLTGQQLTLKLWHALFCSINLPIMVVFEGKKISWSILQEPDCRVSDNFLITDKARQSISKVTGSYIVSF